MMKITKEFAKPIIYPTNPPETDTIIKGGR